MCCKREKDRTEFQKWAVSTLRRGGVLTLEGLSSDEKLQMIRLQKCGIVVRSKTGYSLLATMLGNRHPFGLVVINN
jgi:hypothetical protein